MSSRRLEKKRKEPRFFNSRWLARALGAWLAPLGLAGCGDQGEAQATYEWALPAGFPEPLVPADNLMSVEKVTLGRYLFFDKRLSVNGTMACASCHLQHRAFSDGVATPTGATGQRVSRNSPSLSNVAYLYPYTWANPLLHTLEEQALVPLFAEFPVELGLSAVIGQKLTEFSSDPIYAELFPRAFPDEETPFRPGNVARALASFERTLISGSSPFDRFAYGGDDNALSADAKLGFALFNSERFECYHCHSGLLLTSSFRAQGRALSEPSFANNGLYNLGPDGQYPAASPGLSGITGNSKDNGKFRIPSLRNVAVTAPYMHDGSIATLEEVLDHYAAGGRLVKEGENAGDGRQNPNKSNFVRGFSFRDTDKQALLAFLASLTDEAFLADPRFSDPWSLEQSTQPP